MLKIDRLVLRLPADYAGRGESLARAVAGALRERTPERDSATLGPVASGTSDAEVARSIARALAPGKPGGKGKP